MTTTLQRPDTTSIDQHEFDVPCEAIQGCPNSADWQCLVEHTSAGCPGGGFICDHHKATVETVWLVAIQECPLKCAECGRMISPLLGDNLKWIPLHTKAAS